MGVSYLEEVNKSVHMHITKKTKTQKCMVIFGA